MTTNRKPAKDFDAICDHLAVIRARLQACPDPAACARFLARLERQLPGITALLGEPIDGLKTLDWIAED